MIIAITGKYKTCHEQDSQKLHFHTLGISGISRISSSIHRFWGRFSKKTKSWKYILIKSLFKLRKHLKFPFTKRNIFCLGKIFFYYFAIHMPNYPLEVSNTFLVNSIIQIWTLCWEDYTALIGSHNG